MKKVTLLAAVVAMFAFASCKKDYSCSCVSTTTTSAGSTTGDPDVTTIKEVKKVQAGALCADRESVETTTSGGTTSSYTVTTDCTLSKK